MVSQPLLLICMFRNNDNSRAAVAVDAPLFHSWEAFKDTVVIHTDAPECILIFNVKCSLVFPPRRNSREISMLQSDMAS